MGNLTRWMKYGRAKLDDLLKSGNDELDRREAEREVDAAERPWAHATSDVPTLDEVRQRIEPGAPAAPATEATERVELDAQQREATERLTRIREELGLGGEDPPHDA